MLTVTMPEARSSLMSTGKGQKLFYLAVDSLTVMETAHSDDGCCLSWCRAGHQPKGLTLMTLAAQRGGRGNPEIQFCL